jgi:hypothetical protein
LIPEAPFVFLNILSFAALGAARMSPFVFHGCPMVGGLADDGAVDARYSTHILNLLRAAPAPSSSSGA